MGGCSVAFIAGVVAATVIIYIYLVLRETHHHD